MSYDVTLYKGPQEPCPTCGHHAKTDGIELFSENHTSNTSQMWRKAGCDLAEFHGKLAHELTEPLGLAIQRIEHDLDDYKQYEPANGWGSVLSTLRFLKSIHAACIQHPKAVIDVDR